MTEPASREAHQRLAELVDGPPRPRQPPAATTTTASRCRRRRARARDRDGPAAPPRRRLGWAPWGCRWWVAIPAGASSPLVEAGGGGGLGGLLRPGGGIVQLEGVGEAANAAAVTAEGSAAAVTAEGSEAELASYRGLDATELLSRVGVLKGEANKASPRATSRGHARSMRGLSGYLA